MGTILKTTNGGDHWIQKVSNTTEHLNKVDFANSTTGYTVGENGTLLKTLDAGETWSVVNTGVTEELYAVSCVNENIVYISGENGLIKKTDDGGTTWSIQDSGIAVPIYSIQFVSENIGYASAGGHSDLNYFLKTIDSGVTWTTESLGGGPTFSLFFYNELIGFRSSAEFNKTIDGGDTWEMFLLYDALTFSIDAITPDTVWTAGHNVFEYKGHIYKGELNLPMEEVWTNVSPYLEYFVAIDFVNETTGYAVGFNDNDGTGLIMKNSTGINTLSHNIHSTQKNIKVFPNPISNILYIYWNNSPQIKTKIKLINILGKTVYLNQTDNTTNLSIDVSHLAKGVYTLLIHNVQYQQYQKIIIQ